MASEKGMRKKIGESSKENRERTRTKREGGRRKEDGEKEEG